MKPKILVFNGYYYPSKNCGGPITSIENVINACFDEFDFYIVCYNHDFNDKTPFEVELMRWIKTGHANVMYVEHNYMDFSAKKNLAFLLDLKPNLIWFSGVLTPNNKLVTVKNSRKLGIPVLFSPRGELSADRIAIKSYKKIPYLFWLKLTKKYRNCYFHGTSDDEIEGIKKFFAPDDNHLFRCANIAILQQNSLVKHSKACGILRVIFFSRIHPVKNVLFAIKCLKNCKERVLFDIYGPIEDKEYWLKCEDSMSKLPNNISVRYCGLLNNDNKNFIIQEHDCLLFPTINENYGHVIAETLANSRPVIISKGTTPWDDLDGIAGRTIDLNSDKDFSKAIDFFAKLDNEQYKTYIESVKNYFRKKNDENNSITGHMEMFNDIIKRRI